MKRYVLLFIILLSLLLTFSASAAELNEIIPSADLWGLSPSKLDNLSTWDFESCVIGNTKGLHVEDVEIDDYNMDGYYVFAKNMGKYHGLSKIVFLLPGKDKQSSEDLNECYHDLADSMKDIIGEPDSEKDVVTSWDREDYTVEIGKGKFSQYTGSKHTTVAIVFKEKEHPVATNTNKNQSSSNSKSKKKKSSTSDSMVKVKIGSETVEVSKSFKQTMDDYEEFFDNYIELMNNPDDLFALAEATANYTKTMEELEDMEDDLSDSELAYYLEVHSRITEKLSKASGY